MQIVHAFKDLWRLLDFWSRIHVCALVFLLFISGLLEMAGMAVIFAYIAGLSGADSSPRAQIILDIYALLFGQTDQTSFAITGGTALIAVFLVKNLAVNFTERLLDSFLMKQYQKVARGLLEGYLRLPYEIFQTELGQKPRGQIMGALGVFQKSFATTLQILSDIAIIFLISLFLLYIDFWVTLGTVTLFGLVGSVFHFLTRRSYVALGREQQQKQAEARKSLTDAMQSFIDTRLTHTEEQFIHDFQDSLRQAFSISEQRASFGRMPKTVNEILLSFTVVCAVLYFAFSAKGITAALPVLATFGFAGLRLVRSSAKIVKNLQGLDRNASNRCDMMETIENIAPRLLNHHANTPIAYPMGDYLAESRPLPPDTDGRMKDKLILKNVTFTYPGTDVPTIRNASLEIEKGQFIGFCGPSGGGKTTLMLLIMGLVKPQEGEILCDGQSIFSYIRDWHRGIGYVKQSPSILKRSVRENIAFGRPLEAIDDERVWEALKLAHLDEFIGKLPGGLDADLGAYGKTLSGGQKQRLCIARALYDDPEILIFDEATAALDNITEREVKNAVRRLSSSRTIIYVAHRLTTLHDADRIFVVQDGHIENSGTYEELLQISPLFKEMA